MAQADSLGAQVLVNILIFQTLRRVGLAELALCSWGRSPGGSWIPGCCRKAAGWERRFPRHGDRRTQFIWKRFWQRCQKFTSIRRWDQRSKSLPCGLQHVHVLHGTNTVLETGTVPRVCFSFPLCWVELFIAHLQGCTINNNYLESFKRYISLFLFINVSLS